MKVNKKIALSFLTIAGTLTAVVGITLAQFNSQVTLAGNTLTTGSSELGIGTEDCNSTSSAIGGVSSTGITPGGSGSKDFCLKNTSSGSLDITAMATKTGGDLDEALVEVTVECDSNGAKVVDFSGSPSDLIITLPADMVAQCSITQALSGTATSSAQNKSISYDVVFTGEPAT